MARYKDQIESTKAAHMAARALSDAALVKIQGLSDQLESGDLTIAEFGKEARAVVRFSYRESSTVARTLVKDQSGLPKWRPGPVNTKSAYLESLLLDVDKNLKEYESSDQGDKAVRKLRLRVRLSATTAAQRGFTDAQLTYYGELRELGHRVSKLWLANFLNNDPCADCTMLHGTEVAFEDEFPVPTLMKTSVYRDLQGPPLHVNCKCVMVVLITRADNFLDSVDTRRLSIPTTMSTETVKGLPWRIFSAILKALKVVMGGLVK